MSDTLPVAKFIFVQCILRSALTAGERGVEYILNVKGQTDGIWRFLAPILQTSPSVLPANTQKALKTSVNVPLGVKNKPREGKTY